MKKGLEEELVQEDMKLLRISWLCLGFVWEIKEAGLFSSLGALINFSLKIPNIFAMKLLCLQMENENEMSDRKA